MGLVGEGRLEYRVPRNQLASAFIQQFGDGTVVDKVTIQKVQESKQDPATYYLVGLGMRDGHFRAMAMPLQASADLSLYLSPGAERYVLTSVGCPFCFFSFEKNRIVGTSCEENSGGSRCDMTIEKNNSFFAR